eukprot:6199761-Pleurochrysis_carterae.AAC.3
MSDRSPGGQTRRSAANDITDQTQTCQSNQTTMDSQAAQPAPDLNPAELSMASLAGAHSPNS